MEETIDRVIESVMETVVSLPERRRDVDLRNMISVRMTVDEGVGYRGGQRLAHERPYLLLPALELYSNASWHAMRRSRFDRSEYRAGFHEGYFDELAGTAHPLPPEQARAFLY